MEIKKLNWLSSTSNEEIALAKGIDNSYRIKYYLTRGRVGIALVYGQLILKSRILKDDSSWCISNFKEIAQKNFEEMVKEKFLC